MSRFAGLFIGEKPTEAPDAIEQPTLLLVDDEPGVLKALGRLFEDTSYRILTAESAGAALDILAREPVALVMSDHRMPGMTGAQLLAQVRERWPDTIRIMLTGCADVDAVMGAVNDGAVYKFITKPWQDEDLLVTIARALEARDLAKENKQLRVAKEAASAELDEMRGRYVGLNRSQLCRMLVRAGLLEEDGAALANAEQKKTNEPMPSVLVGLDLLGERVIAAAIKKAMDLDTIDLDEFPIEPAALQLVPERTCRVHGLIPIQIRDNKRLIIAMCDPTDYAKIDDLRFMTGLEVQPALATRSAVESALDRYHGGAEADASPFALPPEEDPHESLEVVIEDDDDPIEELIASDEPPAIRIVNAILAEAIRHGASDVHMEPRVKYLAIRYRINGLLSEKFQIPKQLQPQVLSRMKITSGLDIAERRRPQDGRATVRYGTRTVDMRVSTLPTIHGEKIVIRLLDRDGEILSMEELGLSEDQYARVKPFIDRPQGIILTTGPTGSGKTTTLYSLLSASRSDTKSYITIEDPVEYHLEGAGQVHVREKVGLTFAKTLRSVLRQDPNVVMLGEVRDTETAEVAFRAAMTGHLVLSTLHTNSSVASVTRLKDLGVQTYLIASAVEGIIAQRLVRRVCEECAEEYEPDPELLERLRISKEELGTVRRGKGCVVCSRTGYSGQLGLYEVFVVTEEIRQLLLSGAPEAQLLAEARRTGMKTLGEDALEKVRAGRTTVEEILRVLGPAPPQMTCGSCDGEIEASFHVCPHCGTKQKHTCGGCARPIEPTWQHCPDCGDKQTKEKPKLVV